MAKPWRVRYAGAKYHLAGKGNGWAVFLGREDYARFMEQFDAALEADGVGYGSEAAVGKAR